MGTQYSRGNFSFTGEDEMMLKTAFDAVNSVSDGWEELKKNPGNDGFLFSRASSKINEIYNKIDEIYPLHSGCSYALTMRHMQYIALYGWDEYLRKFIPIYESSFRNDIIIVEENLSKESISHPIELNTECCICLTQETAMVCSTNCNHIFHKTCLETWVLKNKTKNKRECPLCRTVIKEVTIKKKL